MWGVFNLIPSANLLSKSKKRGFVGAFLAGILGGIFSSPCSTPVLIALLAIVAGNGNLLWGILLMLLYSIGHSALVMVAGTSVGFVQRISGNTRYNKAETVLKVEYITDLQKVVGYGAMSMPALVVNEKVVAMGKVLKAADVEKLLHKLGF